MPVYKKGIYIFVLFMYKFTLTVSSKRFLNSFFDKTKSFTLKTLSVQLDSTSLVSPCVIFTLVFHTITRCYYHCAYSYRLLRLQPTATCCSPIDSSSRHDTSKIKKINKKNKNKGFFFLLLKTANRPPP